MKRVKAACILQTLVFAQKEDCDLSRNSILDNNRREFAHYKQTLERTHTRYQIVSCDSRPVKSGGCIFVLSAKKQQAIL